MLNFAAYRKGSTGTFQRSINAAVGLNVPRPRQYGAVYSTSLSGGLHTLEGGKPRTGATAS